jgi:hypothetical protein
VDSPTSPTSASRSRSRTAERKKRGQLSLWLHRGLRLKGPSEEEEEEVLLDSQDGDCWVCGLTVDNYKLMTGIISSYSRRKKRTAEYVASPGTPPARTIGGGGGVEPIPAVMNRFW